MAELDLADIDAFIVGCRHHDARTTVADMASSLRGFLRFLHATGCLAVDLASSVMAPVVRRGERPLRALPWEEALRILRAVDRSTAGGRRDYALLLLMSVYGLGAGEALHLHLEDIDWRGAILHVTRPKTGVSVQLPLLPAVARVLVDIRATDARNIRARAISLSACGHLMDRSAPPRPCGTSCTNMPELPVSRRLISAVMCCVTPMPAGSSSKGCRPR